MFKHHSQSGVTLLELMVAIAVLGVLLGVGVPAFTNIVRANQIAAKSNDMVIALTLARSEAIKRGIRVSVCSLDAPPPSTTCATTASWGNGWLVFADDFGSAGVFDASDVAIQSWEPPAGGLSIQADAGAFAVTFTRSGRAELQRAFTVTKEGCTGDQARTISVGMSGRVSLARDACP